MSSIIEVFHSAKITGALIDIKDETDRQIVKWGIQDHLQAVWMTILGEEYGEACKSALDGDADNYEIELIQVAAVAVSALVNFRQQRLTKSEDEHMVSELSDTPLGG